jgi:hypothetical protein
MTDERLLVRRIEQLAALLARKDEALRVFAAPGNWLIFRHEWHWGFKTDALPTAIAQSALSLKPEDIKT